MDLSLVTIFFGLMGAEIALYFWEEPKISALEKGRRRKIRHRIEKLIPKPENNPDRESIIETVTDYLYIAYADDSQLVIPIEGPLKPHRRIVKLLLIGLVSGAAYGVLVSVGRGLNAAVVASSLGSITLSNLCAAVTLACYGIATWLGIQEFKYLRKIMGRFTNGAV